MNPRHGRRFAVHRLQFLDLSDSGIDDGVPEFQFIEIKTCDRDLPVIWKIEGFAHTWPLKQ